MVEGLGWRCPSIPPKDVITEEPPNFNESQSSSWPECNLSISLPVTSPLKDGSWLDLSPPSIPLSSLSGILYFLLTRILRTPTAGPTLPTSPCSARVFLCWVCLPYSVGSFSIAHLVSPPEVARWELSSRMLLPGPMLTAALWLLSPTPIPCHSLFPVLWHVR